MLLLEAFATRINIRLLARFISVLMRYLRVFPVGSYKISLCLYKTIWFDDHCFEIQDSK